MDRAAWTAKRVRQGRTFLDRLLGVHARRGAGEIVLILSFPRSGTTMLGTAFESVGAPVYYYGELIGLTSLTPDFGIVLRRHPIFALRLLRAFAAQRRSWRPYSFEAEHLDVETLLGTFATTSGVHVAKVFWDHLSDGTLARVLEGFRPTVIFLRRNHYDRFVSHMRAVQNRAWHGRPYEHHHVEVTEEQLQSWANDYADWYRRTRLRCDELHLRTIDVSFEELVAPGAVNELIAETCADRIPSSRAGSARPATERQTTTPPTSDEAQLRERYAFPALDRS